MLKRDGIALIAVLGLLIIISGLIALIGTRMANEIQTDGDDIAIVQTLALARGGANLGARLLAGPVEDSLDAVVEASSRVINNGSRWTFDRDNTQGNEPNPANVASDLARLAGNLQTIVDNSLCNQTSAVGTGTVSIRVYVTPQSTCNGVAQSLPDGVQLPDGRYVDGAPRSGRGSLSVQTYAVPFVLVSEGVVGDYERQVLIQGEYHIKVGAGSFARYALFTNRHTAPDGGGIWFTSNTLFDGPVHTNNFFRFFEQPWFGGEVTSASCQQPTNDGCGDAGSAPGGEFWSPGYVLSQDMTNAQNPSFVQRDDNNQVIRTHEPDFTEGVNWDSGYIGLPQNDIDQQNAAEGVDEDGNDRGNAGLTINGNAELLEMWAADANGDPLTQDNNGNWVPDATFQYIRDCDDAARQNCRTYRYDDNSMDAFPELERLVTTDPEVWAPQEAEFNGMIYVNGSVDRLTGPPRTPVNSADGDDAPPALASFATINVTANANVRLTGDLTYEDPPCSGSPTRNNDGSVTRAECENLHAQNVLGVFTPSGDVLIGHANQDQTMNAPSNLTVHGVLMSSSGAVTVENFREDDGVARGSMRLLGGMIENFYGGFGTFDPNSGDRATGYGRQFTYDRRMADGLAPPFFPTIGEEEIKDTTLFSFGQREQIN